jgi:ankyrin repeat protein
MLQVPYSADSFVKQAGEGDTIAIKTFLAAGMNVNARNEKGFTALIKATEMGHTETVQSLLAAGADPNLDNFESHYSALMMAAYKGDVPTMKVLIAGGADVNLQFRPNEDNALFAAAAYGQRDAVAFLLDNKASIDAKSPSRGTPLVASACQAGKFDTARLLVERGADVNAQATTSLQTPLGCAAAQRNVEFIQLLLDKGANINTPNDRGYTPLHLALDSGPRDMEKATASALLLISRGANVNATRTDNTITPLDMAVQNRQLDVVRALLDKGANPNKGLSRLPLASALYGNKPHTEIVLLLIDRGADVNAVGPLPNEGSPLIMAVQAKEVAIIRALLAKGADPNFSTRNGLTPLRAAAESPEIMQILITAGAKQ